MKLLEAKKSNFLINSKGFFSNKALFFLRWGYYMGASFKEKIKNAYLLFYERVKPIENLNKIGFMHEESKEFEVKAEKEKKTEEIVNPLEEFHNELIENNFKFQIHRNIFSPEFFKFICILITERSYSKNRDYLAFPFRYDLSKEEIKWKDLEILKLGLNFLLFCIIREKERNSIVKILPFLKKELKKVSFFFSLKFFDFSS